MPGKPVKYVIYFKRRGQWVPSYRYKTRTGFNKCMDNLARLVVFAPGVSYIVRVNDDLDGKSEWYTVKFHQNGFLWSMESVDRDYLRKNSPEREREFREIEEREDGNT